MRDEVRRARLSIHDMLDAIEVARKARADLKFEQFAEALVNRLAAERAIEIVSEASRRIPENLKEKESGIPWPKIAGVGNVLRHNYRDVAPRAIWNVIQNELAPLEAALRRMLARIGEE
jgi:uncharacterized protein with HEPN domain